MPKDAGEVEPVLHVDGEQAAVLRARDEWLLTNGLGGFASGTVSGVPERRYHAWLVGATNPPVGRVAALMGCAEWLVFADGRRVALHALRFLPAGSAVPDDPRVQPAGLVEGTSGAVLRGFRKGPRWCSWDLRLAAEGISVVRTLRMEYGVNRVSVEYSLAGDVPKGTVLEVRPLVALRDFHELVTAHDEPAVEATGPRGLRAFHDTRCPGAVLELASPTGSATPQAQWWRDFWYAREHERGQAAREHLLGVGLFAWDMTRERSAALSATLRSPADGAGGASGAGQDPLPAVLAHVGAALAHADDATRARGALLAAAADQFVVRRAAPAASRRAGDEALRSIIAGYPWFSDWGRDTAIALPGLLLETGRFAEALTTLRAFANLTRRGLVPNCFDNGTGAAQYNTVDASLWFVLACCAYRERTRDDAGFRRDLLPACLAIVRAYHEGTDFGIRADADGLIMAGSATTQLTWMDAQRDGVVFTPRWGKPVEISALWHSALRGLARATTEHDAETSRTLSSWADRTKASFAGAFWDASRGCLFDCLTPASGAASASGWKPSPDLRPNQIFAVSLSDSPLSREQQRSVVRVVEERLLTPFGLRTLDAESPQFSPRFDGPLFERDRAYHNGTVWPWLLGPFCRALLRVEQSSDAARARCVQLLEPLLSELDGATRTARGAGGRGPRGQGVVSVPVGQLAEVYDATSPQRPDGCHAQAWSVAEVLGVLVEASGNREA